MKYKAGDKVRIRSKEWYESHKNKFGKIWTISLSGEGTVCFDQDNAKYCGKEVTIFSVEPDNYVLRGIPYEWTDEMIEGLVDEETKPKYEDEVNGEYYSTPKYLVRPSGYQFVDENGNVINAMKIVLEKKKKDVNLTQEQINTMVHDSCVLFCKHYGCGIPRETCTSLGTCKEHDEYRAAIRTHLMEKKKKEYPKTYEEGCEILKEQADVTYGYKKDVLHSFQKLLVCRDAYWKIAGDEMGLGKPWKPDWEAETSKYIILCKGGEIQRHITCRHSRVLAFPTEEMRDAFYENFKELIESCKELL